MPKKTLLFAPVAYNLAETTRALEIAKGIRNHAAACQVFDIQFISDGGDFERLIEEEGFLLKRIEPRLTAEKIEFVYKFRVLAGRHHLGGRTGRVYRHQVASRILLYGTTHCPAGFPNSRGTQKRKLRERRKNSPRS